jgi:transposase-like protein/IS1 family transposase
MTCTKCQHPDSKKFGTTAANVQRFQCKACRATFTAARQNPLGRHTTTLDATERAVSLLLEGMSLRAVARLTGLHKGTLSALLLTVGSKCADLFDARVRNVRANFVQADELWSFVGKKQKRVKVDDPAAFGDQYTWVALDSETKLVLTYHVGKRNSDSAMTFMRDLSERVTGRCQLSTDGFEAYPGAVEEYFGADVDFAQVIKNYAPVNTDGPDWFRPSSRVTSITLKPITGNPDETRISTSHVERLNLTLRMHNRRFTRLTNGFSKSLDHLRAAVALFMAYYNFCKVHQTLRVTPAMEARLTDHVWTIRELLTVETAARQAA